jgi:hypothetical protein
MKKQLAGKGVWIAVATITMLALISCSSPANSDSSDENRILTFTVSGAETEIEEASSRITIFYPAGTGITSLAPTITVSGKATVSPASLAPRDFTEPVGYTVTAENGATRTYTAMAVALPADLNTALSEAGDVKSGIVTASSAAEVPAGTEWVPQEALDALNAAVAQAESVATRPDATDAEKAEATRDLAKAIADFENAKQTGTRTGTGTANKTALSAAIAAANAAKTGVVVNTDAANVAAGTTWVTQTALDALNTAIGAAETVSTNAEATQEQADGATSDLTAATTVFTNAKQTGTKTETGAANKTALSAAIAEANAAKTGVVVNTDAANVAAGTTWVTQAVLDALNAAIGAAETVSANAEATQVQADGAASDLTAATATFANAKQAGTKTETEAANKTALSAAIAAANAAKTGIVVNTDAANVPAGTTWVTQAVLDALNAAITTAEGVSENAEATQAQVDGAASDLTAAAATFANAKQAGTKTETEAADKTALSAAIAAANAAKTGVVVNTDAANVPAGDTWVTQIALNALNAAIATAEGVSENAEATQAQVDAAAGDLTTATTTFNNAKQTGTKAGPAEDKTALSAAITAANAAKTDIVVNTDAANVAEGTTWVTQAVLDALNAAIGAAETVSANAEATQAQVDAATSDLTAATGTFNNAKQAGTKPGPAEDKTALTAAIAAANAAKTDVVVNTDAANVLVGTAWVTQAVLDALNTAIGAAETVSANAEATQAQADAATSALTTATGTFNNAKQAGTKPGPAEDKTALGAAIAAANAAKSGVAVNTVAVNVPVGTAWVTQAVLDALNAAIGAAETVSANAEATQAQADAATSALTEATGTFNDAKQDGTFVAVTNINFTGVAVNGTSGYPVSLAGAAAEPGNATNKTIVWTVKTADAGVIAAGSFTPAISVAPGSQVQLTATVANGSAPGADYSIDHTITVNAPGTTTSGVDFGDDTSIKLLGNGNSLLSRDTTVNVSLNATYYVSLVGSYTDIVWYLNGTEQTVTENRIYLNTSTAKTIKLVVMATKDGKGEGSGTYTFVIAQP